MRSRLLAPLILLALAVGLQALLPLASGDLTIANPFLGLLTVLGLRQGKVPGTLWGAALGTMSDAYTMPHLGFHGAAFTLIGYLLGWIGSKVVIQGVLPLFFFSAGAYVLDSVAVVLLYLLLGLPLPSSLWVYVAAGSLLTGVLAAGLEAAARRLYPRE